MKLPLAFLCCSVSLFLSLPSLAQEETPPLERVAFTEPPEGDTDFDLMGEFVGPIKKGEGQYEPLGLQIRAVGNNNFEAIQYIGGLPGQDTYANDSVKLIGRRNGDLLVLSGGPWAFFVDKDRCTVIDRDGNRLGQLERIARTSPTMGARAPEGATVLFDGSNIDHFTTASMTLDGLLMEGADIKPMFQDFNLHVEFRLPYMPHSLGQQRANSGCYLQSRYEVQVLDSFAELPTFNGCSSLYRTKAPDLNMCYPPLTWQTYDIMFTAPRWAADGTKLRNARITVWQNGVKTQDDFELGNKTGAGKPEAPNLLPSKIQDHSDPVRFRNIWIVDRGLSQGEFPVYPKPGEEIQWKPKSDVTEPAAENSEAAAENSEPAEKEQPTAEGDATAAEPAEETKEKSAEATAEARTS